MIYSEQRCLPMYIVHLYWINSIFSRCTINLRAWAKERDILSASLFRNSFSKGMTRLLSIFCSTRTAHKQSSMSFFSLTPATPETLNILRHVLAELWKTGEITITLCERTLRVRGVQAFLKVLDTVRVRTHIARRVRQSVLAEVAQWDYALIFKTICYGYFRIWWKNERIS